MWWSRLMSPAQRNDLSSEPEHALCPSSPSRPHSAATPRGRVHRPSGVRVPRGRGGRAWRNPSRAWFCCGTVPWISTKSLPTKVEDRHDLVPTATVKRQQSHPFSFSRPFNPGPVAHSCRVNPGFYGLVHFRAIWLQKLGLLWWANQSFKGDVPLPPVSMR